MTRDQQVQSLAATAAKVFCIGKGCGSVVGVAVGIAVGNLSRSLAKVGIRDLNFENV